MHGLIPRQASAQITESLIDFPAVALLGPRQCGKTTLSREIVASLPAAIYLDLEKPSDLRKLQDPELFFQMQRASGDVALVCLDEIQRTPELFPILRSVIDEGGRNGQFLILGSASRDLIQQTSETLAGRIRFLELTPFLASEVEAVNFATLATLWLRGGFPRSFLARSHESSRHWRESFVRTFLERDIPQLGFSIPAGILDRLWRMLAHTHGQLLNSSKFGAALGLSHTTVRSYLNLLTQTYMVRTLEPLVANVKKRVVKSPKVYVRDSGILHALLEIRDENELLGHPIYGSSWEGFVVENIIASLPDWQPNFYRTTNGAEIDLVLARGRTRIAVECKAATAPTLSRGMRSALQDLAIDEAWIVAPVTEPYPVTQTCTVSPLVHFLQNMASRS